MDWVKLIVEQARVSGVLRVDDLAREFNVSEVAIGNALRRQEQRGLVEHLGKKIFINRLAYNFSGRELINIVRPEAYLSLETVPRYSGVSTQSPIAQTCVTPGRPGEFRAKSVAIAVGRSPNIRRILKNVPNRLLGPNTPTRCPLTRPPSGVADRLRLDYSHRARSRSRFAGRLVLAQHSAQIEPCLRPREQRHSGIRMERTTSHSASRPVLHAAYRADYAP